jgi:hypothetical protein
MFRKTRRTVEERVITDLRTELSRYSRTLARDRVEYRERLRRKQEASAALSSAEAEVERLRSERVEVKKKFWEAHYEEDEAALSRFERRCRSLERAIKKAEKSLRRAQASFEKADFDEVAQSFALKAKADRTEEEVERRIVALVETLEDLLAEMRQEVEEASQALRDEYEEPSFDTAEEQDAHVKKTTEILNELAKSYTPGK